MKKPVTNKIAFDDQAVDSAKARRSFRGSSENRLDSAAEPRSRPPKVVYKRCRQAIVESMVERLADDELDSPIAPLTLDEDWVSHEHSQHRQDLPQQQQQAGDHAALDEALREQVVSLSKLRWAGLKYKKVLDS